MPAPIISHLICSIALIALIFVMQFSYFYIVENIQIEMIKRELKEVADYVSHTLENLRFLVNSTTENISLEKELSLPPIIKGSIYVVEILGNVDSASSISAYLKDRFFIRADSWLIPGLKILGLSYVESGEKKIIAGCRREGVDIYVWIQSGGEVV